MMRGSGIVRTVAISLITFFIIHTSHASAEDRKSLEVQLRQIYEHKLLSLRNPSFGRTLSFDSSGIPMNHIAAGPWSTCGLLEVQKLRLSQNSVEIDGKRVILALRSEEVNGQAVTPEKVQVVPVKTDEDVRIRLQVSPVNVSQINGTLAQIFQAEKLLARVSTYWKPMTGDFKAFRQNTPDGVVGELEGNRPVYFVNRGVVKPPKATHTPDPEYTEVARRKRTEGTTVLRIVVNEKGLPEILQIVRGLEEGLDIQALVAVASWRFDPALRDGKPVPVLINVSVTFHLR